jgi:hypothetical protein
MELIALANAVSAKRASVHEFIDRLQKPRTDSKTRSKKRTRIFGYSLEPKPQQDATILKLHGMDFPTRARTMAMQRAFARKHIPVNDPWVRGWLQRTAKEPQLPPDRTLHVITLLTRLKQSELEEIMTEHGIPRFALISRGFEQPARHASRSLKKR